MRNYEEERSQDREEYEAYLLYKIEAARTSMRVAVEYRMKKLKLNLQPDASG